MNIKFRKKLTTAIVTAAVMIINALLPEPLIDEATVTKLVALASTYFVGQGIADYGKDAK